MNIDPFGWAHDLKEATWFAKLLRRIWISTHYADHPWSLPVNRIRQPSAGHGQPLATGLDHLANHGGQICPNHHSYHSSCASKSLVSQWCTRIDLPWIINWTLCCHLPPSPLLAMGDSGPPCVCIKRSFQRPSLCTHGSSPQFFGMAFPHLSLGEWHRYDFRFTN